MRVLLVEDSPRVIAVVSAVLRKAGHVVAEASTRHAGLEETARARFELAIVDIGLPDGSGLDLCRELRAGGHDFPILLLTARNGVGDRVSGLDAGADDYLGKPFATDELLARVRALGRRGPRWSEAIKTFGDVVIDRERRTAMRAGQRVALTPREFDVVAALAWRDGRVVMRDELLEMVWGSASEREAASLEVLVSRIRRKLGSKTPDDVVRTIRGTGYAWALGRSNPT
jgi:two-component system OmpR family response regulator